MLADCYSIISDIFLPFCGLATNLSLDADKNHVTHDLSYFSVPATRT